MEAQNAMRTLDDMIMVRDGLGGGGIHRISATTGTNTYTAVNHDIEQYMTAGLLADGETLTILVNFATANTGASTLNINGLGARAIVDEHGQSVRVGVLNGIQLLDDNGTHFRTLSIARLLLTRLPTSATANRVLRVGAANTDPVYGQVAMADITSSATANRILRVAGANTAPTWAQVGMTTDVTGILPIANGGTGVATGSVNRIAAQTVAQMNALALGAFTTQVTT